MHICYMRCDMTRRFINSVTRIIIRKKTQTFAKTFSVLLEWCGRDGLVPTSNIEYNYGSSVNTVR